MAAVPERDAGVGSAVNDVSRQLGGALGVAVIGSFVISAYRNKLHHAVRGEVPTAAVHAASNSVGVAAQAARSLPPDLAATLTRAANHAFVSAITRGFEVSMVVVALAFVVAATMVPRHMRTAQLEAEPSPPRPEASPPHERPEPAIQRQTAPASWARPAIAHLQRENT
jgi:hypothetical protein